MTSVAIAPPAIDEPVSPELALVDPELRERLRALLPVIELEPPTPLLRAVPDPDIEVDRPLAPPPELVGEAAPVAAAAPLQVPVYVYPTRGDRFRSFAKAFALGAAVAAVVTVGVVAELGEGPAAPQDPSTTPPRIVAPAVTPKVTPGGAEQPKPSKPHASGRTGTGRPSQAKAGATSRAKTQRPNAKAATTTGAGGKKAQAKQQPSKRPATAARVEPKRFAWAPVDGAVGYRFELFRGDKQVLEVRTKTPAYELAGTWKHAGRTETLSTGQYRWYVWPVLQSGPAASAVVQARLTVP